MGGVREYPAHLTFMPQALGQLGSASSAWGLGVIFCQLAGTSNCSGEMRAGSIEVVSIVTSATVIKPASAAPDLTAGVAWASAAGPGFFFFPHSPPTILCAKAPAPDPAPLPPRPPPVA